MNATINQKTAYSEPNDLENQIATKVMDAAFLVHREMGAGLLESVYEECMVEALQEINLCFERQKEVPVTFRNKKLNCGFRADLVIENCVLIELKSVSKLDPVHEAQLINYLRLADIKIGFLINFNVPLLKQGLKRFVNGKSNVAPVANVAVN